MWPHFPRKKNIVSTNSFPLIWNIRLENISVRKSPSEMFLFCCDRRKLHKWMNYGTRFSRFYHFLLNSWSQLSLSDLQPMPGHHKEHFISYPWQHAPKLYCNGGVFQTPMSKWIQWKATWNELTLTSASGNYCWSFLASFDCPLFIHLTFPVTDTLIGPEPRGGGRLTWHFS